jgi:hypothetical protein
MVGLGWSDKTARLETHNRMNIPILLGKEIQDVQALENIDDDHAVGDVSKVLVL